MRVYRSDGSFLEDSNDIEFGWFLKDIIVDEASINYEQMNRNRKMDAFMRKSLKEKYFSDSDESLDETENERISMEVIVPEIEIQQVKNFVDCESIMNDLLAICNEEEFKNLEQERERIANNLNPCSAEARMLLGVINCQRFKSYLQKCAIQELPKCVNFKSSNLNFLLSNQPTDEHKETNHLFECTKTPSLMMELLSTKIDTGVCDTLNMNSEFSQIQPHFIVDTSDLGNSLPSSSSSRDEKYDKHYLQLPPDKSSILSSLGLSNEEKSIQCYCEETFEMHNELASIKSSFRVSLFYYYIYY